MDHQSLIRSSEVRPLAKTDLAVAGLSADGRKVLGLFAKHFSAGKVAAPAEAHFETSVQVSDHTRASGPWYADREIVALVWPGDLVLDGDLLDDDWEFRPLLVVHGDLEVRNWLRGGMAAFVAGSVRAKGFLVGHYDDSLLFVGGDVEAQGFLSWARKECKDLPDIKPHQVAGKVRARRFDLRNPSEAELTATFVDEVLVRDGEDLFVDERAVMERSTEGLAVWRD